ncbi:hypothetical protein, partial [Streptomyces altiplanensis]
MPRQPPYSRTSPRTDRSVRGGMVGYLGYDVVRRLEKIGEHGRDDLELPELT